MYGIEVSWYYWCTCNINSLNVSDLMILLASFSNWFYDIYWFSNIADITDITACLTLLVSLLFLWIYGFMDIIVSLIMMSSSDNIEFTYILILILLLISLINWYNWLTIIKVKMVIRIYWLHKHYGFTDITHSVIFMASW